MNDFHQAGAAGRPSARDAQRGSPRMRARLSLPSAGVLLAGVLSLGAAAPAAAESDSGTALKNAAIAGTVLSYAAAFIKGARWATARPRQRPPGRRLGRARPVRRG
jgi:amino acid transporter